MSQIQANSEMPKLNPDAILIAEFEYARETASQAMNDRHTMVNYYLLIVGIGFTTITGLINLIKDGQNNFNLNVPLTAAFFLFLISSIGLLFLLKLVRLRQAWYDSARAMNKIKDYYNQNLSGIELSANAFLWTSKSLPRPAKSFTLYFFSALLIILLDTLSLIGALQFLSVNLYGLAITAILSMSLQIGIYQYLLSKSK